MAPAEKDDEEADDDEFSNFLSGNVLDPNFKTRAEALAEEVAAARAAAAAAEAQQRAEHEADLAAAGIHSDKVHSLVCLYIVTE